jgi:hypothetical protein
VERRRGVQVEAAELFPRQRAHIPHVERYSARQSSRDRQREILRVRVYKIGVIRGQGLAAGVDRNGLSRRC